VLNQQSPFTIFPKYTLIHKNSFAHLILEFNPLKQQIFKNDLVMKLNLIHRKVISLKGYCLSSCLHLANKGKLYFSPCYLGVKTLIMYKIRNKGRMKTRLQINVPESYKQELFFKPARFVLFPNQT